MIKVYYAPPSIYGRKVLAVLEEKELDYEIAKMSFETEDHKKEDYLRLNPNGEIPVLMDEDFVVFESTAIIEYLEDEYPEPPLMPEGSEGRARVRMAEDFFDLHVYPEIKRCFIKKVLKQEEISNEDIEKIQGLLKRVAGFLKNQQFLAGNFSLADCAAMPVFASLEALEIFEDTVTLQELKTYANRLKTRKGYKGASLLSFEHSAAS